MNPAVKNLLEAGAKATITAAAVDRATGRQISQPSDEEIDLSSKDMYKNCRTWQDVKEAYEAFWNDTNPNSAEMVLVHGVRMS